MDARSASEKPHISFYGEEPSPPLSIPSSVGRPSPAGGIFKSAAVAVLRRERRLMSTGDICRLALDWGLLRCHGKTPEATMASSMYSDIKRKDRRSMFIRPQEGMFGLREWIDEGCLPPVEYFTPASSIKKAAKAGTKGTGRRKRAYRSRCDDSDYCTEEDEDFILRAELDATSSDNEGPQQRRHKARTRGHPRCEAMTDGQVTASTTLQQVLSGPQGLPTKRLLNFQDYYGFQAGAREYLQPQHSGIAQPAITHFQPTPTLDLGGLPQPEKANLSPPLHVVLHSPPFIGGAAPTTLQAGTCFFSPADATTLSDRASSPNNLSPFAAGSYPLGVCQVSPYILQIHLPPGLPALQLPLPAKPATCTTSATSSLPTSAMKAASGCSLISSSDSALMHCDSVCTSASRSGAPLGGNNEHTIMVPLHVADVFALKQQRAGVPPFNDSTKVSGQPMCSSCPDTTFASFVPIHNMQLASSFQLTPAPCSDTAEVAALVSKIEELEGKVAGIEAKYGPLHLQTGRAYMLLYQACCQHQVAALFTTKAQTALDRAQKSLRRPAPGGLAQGSGSSPREFMCATPTTAGIHTVSTTDWHDQLAPPLELHDEGLLAELDKVQHEDSFAAQLFEPC